MSFFWSITFVFKRTIPRKGTWQKDIASNRIQGGPFKSYKTRYLKTDDYKWYLGNATGQLGISNPLLLTVLCVGTNFGIWSRRVWFSFQVWFISKIKHINKQNKILCKRQCQYVKFNTPEFQNRVNKPSEQRGCHFKYLIK